MNGFKHIILKVVTKNIEIKYCRLALFYSDIHYYLYKAKLKSPADTKELSFYHKLWFSNFHFIATQCRRPLKFPTMNAVRSNNVSLKYQRSTTFGCKEIGIRIAEFVAKTQFL